MRMVFGFLLLLAGGAGLYFVLTGKFPPTQANSSDPLNQNLGANAAGTVPGNFAGYNSTNTTGVTGQGTTIPGTTSGGSSPATATQGQKPAGSGGESLSSTLRASKPLLTPVVHPGDFYLFGGAFR